MHFRWICTEQVLINLSDEFCYRWSLFSYKDTRFMCMAGHPEVLNNYKLNLESFNLFLKAICVYGKFGSQ